MRIIKIKSPNGFQSLGTNDQVTIRGLDGKYRITINDDRIPEYPRIEKKILYINIYKWIYLIVII